MTTVTYSVPNISCGHCEKTIQMELMEIAGVKTVNASEATKQVTVDYEAPATTDQIEAVLEEINYPAAK